MSKCENAVLSRWSLRRLAAAVGFMGVLGGGPSTLCGAEPELPAGFDSSSIHRLDDHRIRIGNVLLDERTREVRVPVAVNMERGLIELIACGPEGKRHESVLVADIRPLHLQVALLLLGLKSGEPVTAVGDSTPPTGDRIKIEFAWSDEGEEKRFPVEHLVRRTDEARPMDPRPWVFAGSRVEDGRFIADVEQSLITTYRDPSSIIDNGLPDGMDDELFQVDSTAVRSRGSAGVLVLSPYDEE